MSGNTKAKETTRKVLTRDEMRAKIFGSKPETRELEFFGTLIELRQPSLGVIMEQRGGDTREAAMMMLMNFAFVPGTEVKVFEAADEELIKQLPFGRDMQELIVAVSNLLGLGGEGLEEMIRNAMKSDEGGASEAADDEHSVGATQE